MQVRRDYPTSIRLPRPSGRKAPIRPQINGLTEWGEGGASELHIVRFDMGFPISAVRISLSTGDRIAPIGAINIGFPGAQDRETVVPESPPARSGNLTRPRPLPAHAHKASLGLARRLRDDVHKVTGGRGWGRDKRRKLGSECNYRHIILLNQRSLST